MFKRWTLCPDWLSTMVVDILEVFGLDFTILQPSAASIRFNIFTSSRNTPRWWIPSQVMNPHVATGTPIPWERERVLNESPFKITTSQMNMKPMKPIVDICRHPYISYIQPISFQVQQGLKFCKTSVGPITQESFTGFTGHLKRKPNCPEGVQSNCFLILPGSLT